MKTLHVLVADDNPINRKIMVGLLRGLGHTGVVVADGAQVLRCLAQQRFDLLLLDVSMPVMDGPQALAAIRAQEAGGRPRLPVIMVTAHDLPSDRERLLAQGADGYVCKPVHVDALDEEICRVFGWDPDGAY